MNGNTNVCINKFVNLGDGYISVKNQGLYYAMVEVDFYLNGQREMYKSSSLKKGKGAEVIIPANATQITLNAYYSNGISYKVFCTKTFDDPEVRCYVLEGTVANPICREVPCSENNLPNYNVCCNCCCNRKNI